MSVFEAINIGVSFEEPNKASLDVIRQEATAFNSLDSARFEVFVSTSVRPTTRS